MYILKLFNSFILITIQKLNYLQFQLKIQDVFLFTVILYLLNKDYWQLMAMRGFPQV